MKALNFRTWMEELGKDSPQETLKRDVAQAVQSAAGSAGGESPAQAAQKVVAAKVSDMAGNPDASAQDIAAAAKTQEELMDAPKKAMMKKKMKKMRKK